MIIATKNKLKNQANFLIETDLGGIVAGIDEAGRGPLSGPVVAACVILNVNSCPEDLNDSKKLSPKQRAKIFGELQNSAQFGVGIVDEKTIDQINILNATKLAMKMAFENMCRKINYKPNAVIVDGNFVPDINCNAKAIVRGDQKSLSIAAASVIAKETRDAIMDKLDQEFPQYNWKQNKGYPTKAHFAAIKEFGICKYHRQSFNHESN
jgi:ribonuclease HII